MTRNILSFTEHSKGLAEAAREKRTQVYSERMRAFVGMLQEFGANVQDPEEVSNWLEERGVENIGAGGGAFPVKDFVVREVVGQAAGTTPPDSKLLSRFLKLSPEKKDLEFLRDRVEVTLSIILLLEQIRSFFPAPDMQPGRKLSVSKASDLFDLIYPHPKGINATPEEKRAHTSALKLEYDIISQFSGAQVPLKQFGRLPLALNATSLTKDFRGLLKEEDQLLKQVANKLSGYLTYLIQWRESHQVA